MRADGDVDRPVGQTRQHVAPIATRDPVGQQFDAKWAVTEQVGGVGNRHPVHHPPHAGRVLLGQHLRGRHQRSLVATLHRGQHGADRDQRLARADVALQQSMHRVRSGEIVLDLGDGPPLRCGELERHGCIQAFRQLATHGVADGLGLAFEHALAHHQHRLHPEQLVEGQPAASLFLLRNRLRGMDGVERGAALDQPVPAPYRLGNRVADPARRTLAQRVFHPPGDLPRHQRGLLALGVDRHDATGAVADQIDNGIRHLQPTAIELRLAEQGDLQPFTQLLLTPRLVEEHHLQPTAAIADHDVDHRPPVAHRSFGHAAHADQDQRLLPRQQVADAGLVGAIDPPPWIGRQQIEHRLDADGVQRCQLLLADTLDPLDADRVQIAQGKRIGHSTPNR